MSLRNRIIFALVQFACLEVFLILFIDQPLSQYVRSLDVSHHQVIDVFRSFTDLGKSIWYLVSSGLGILVSSLLIRWKRISYRSQEFLHKFGEALVFIFLSIAVSGIMADVFKPLLGRARPLLWEREGVYTFHPWSFHSLWNSMPSGHATTAMSLYFVATALVPRGRYVWLVGALILASSRVMVNAHYLSDIIAGTAVAFLSIWLVEKLLERYREPLFKKYLLPLSKKEIL